MILGDVLGADGVDDVSAAQTEAGRQDHLACAALWKEDTGKSLLACG